MTFVFRGTLPILILILSILTILLNNKIGITNKLSKNFTEVTTENGYPTEEHLVTTKDGYQLTVFRIKKGKKCTRQTISTPVLLMHGLFQISDTFIDAGPEAGLAYLLADACFDVWVGNSRGTYYGRKHVSLDPDVDAEFWKFSADEFGLYDLPRKVDYILDITGSKRINYIGFSQGGSIPFLMCLELSEYCDKLGVIVSLSPATRLINTRSIALSKTIEIVTICEHLLQKFGVYEILPKNGIIQGIAEYICGPDLNIVTRFICQGILTILDSNHPDSISDETISSLFRHFPAGTSVRNMARYGQIFNSNRIQKYDFGEQGNIVNYGTPQPPVYDFKRVTVPVVILHGENDYATSVKDSEWAAGELPHAELFVIEDPLWNHFDMVYSKNVKKTIFHKIHSTLLKYND